MKRIIFIVTMLIISLSGYSQKKSITTSATAGDQFYVGSLPNTSNGAYQKLKVKVFGGTFANTSLGTKIFSVSTRDALKILCSQEGGDTGQYTLKVYKTDTGYDFVLLSNWNYASLIVEAWLSPTALAGVNELKQVDIKLYDSTGKEDVTSQFTQVLLPSSDRFGKLGIGTLTPLAMLDVKGDIRGEKLEINGVIRSKEVKIETVGWWSDFVFDQNYQLRPLSEVENFIAKNKHLPDIPSEKEVQEKGIDVTDMQARLLQKIEELTLYIIKQEKRMDEQEKTIEILKQELAK